MEFGLELKKDRELRDVSIEQLAAQTKVSARQVEALESGRFEQLPALVFSRGFVGAIATYLGLDAERTVTAFTHVHKAWAATDPKRKAPLVSPSGSFAKVRLGRSLYTDTTALGLVVAAALALATGLAAFVRSRSAERPGGPTSTSSQPERPESGPASLALPPAIAAATVPLAKPEGPLAADKPIDAARATAPEATRNAPVEAATVLASLPSQSSVDGAGPKTLTLTFQDDCWTEVWVDGKVVAAELFKKGEVRVFSGARRFTLTLGNAGGVVVAVDGHSLDAIGGRGQVVRNFVIGEGEPARRG